jgi:hypothetical protein
MLASLIIGLAAKRNTPGVNRGLFRVVRFLVRVTVVVVMLFSVERFVDHRGFSGC